MLLTFGCSDSYEESKPDNLVLNLTPEVNLIKNWYHKNKDIAVPQSNPWYSFRLNEFENKSKKHNWDKFLSHKNREGKEIIEVNIEFEKTITPKAFLDKQTSKYKYRIQNMLFVKKGKEYNVFIVNYFFLSKVENLSSEQIFRDVNFGYLNPDYEGTVLLLDSKETLLKRWEFTEGKIKLRSHPIKSYFGGKNRSSATFSWECEIEDNRYCNWEGDPVGYGGTLHCGGNVESVCYFNDGDVWDSSLNCV